MIGVSGWEGLLTAKGSRSLTSSSSWNLPFSQSCITAVATTVLEIEPMFCTVRSGSIGTRFSMFAQPYPFDQATRPDLTMQAASPGIRWARRSALDEVVEATLVGCHAGRCGPEEEGSCGAADRPEKPASGVITHIRYPGNGWLLGRGSESFCGLRLRVVPPHPSCSAAHWSRPPGSSQRESASRGLTVSLVPQWHALTGAGRVVLGRRTPRADLQVNKTRCLA